MFFKKNIPNIFTLLRGIITLIITALFITELSNKYLIIYILFLTGALTDFLDGTLARRWKTVSTFGIVFDPLFDKMFVLTLLLLVYPFRVVPEIIIILLFLRDITADAAKNYLLSHGISTPAIRTAKLKTVFQILMLNCVLLALLLPKFFIMTTLALLFGILAVIFSLYSGGIYYKRLFVFIQRNAQEKI